MPEIERLDTHNIEELRELKIKLENVTYDLNDAIEELGKVKQQVEVKNSLVRRLMNQKSTIEEAIRIEKKIFDVLPR